MSEATPILAALLVGALGFLWAAGRDGATEWAVVFRALGETICRRPA